MKPRLRQCVLFAVFAAFCPAQPPVVEEPPPATRLPSGKLQSDEILKQELADNRKDAARLVQLAQELSTDLDKNGTYVFSLGDRKKAEDIEKLARKIRSRMEHR